MRIAQVAPLYESVPPKLYGGTERIVSYLTEELVHLGHDVTLFASGDSRTSARLVPAASSSLRLNPDVVDPLSFHLTMLEQVYRLAHRFDIIHFHIDYLHFPLTRREGCRNVTTLHGRLDIPELVPLYSEFDDMPLVSISDEQRRPLPKADWRGTIYHGLPPENYEFHPTDGGYLAFLGRVSREKRVDRAIEIAKRADLPLMIAAKVDTPDREYFEDEIRPLLDDPHIEFLGEISDQEKSGFLGNARALLFPIDWPEPFGLVMVESLACGTPVIAYNHGSVPEVMRDGLTGYIASSIETAVEAVHRIGRIDRRRCREYFEERFTARRMAEDYVDLYERMLQPSRVVIAGGQRDLANSGRGLLHSHNLVEHR
ncbi:MAG: glycosyl transferase [Actinobacteria bacterium HGW-Actinobacteria-10]|nr:MAG: glycosyl transferase [Actinobacteria bacterium HGW-Actinobacteria-10]